MLETTEHRAGALLEELLMCGVLTVDDLAAAVGRPHGDVSVDINENTVTITTDG
jgi:hypothetical protein